MTQRMELLAPAGGMEQLKAALRFGADAVYGGMRRYGLRAYAGNFGPEELEKAVTLAHAHGARFYLTLNALPADGELEGFVQAARTALEAGVDAAIVADVGAAALLGEQVHGLKLHISTQMNVMNAPAAAAMRRLCGAERVVLSRELSMAQVADLCRALPCGMEAEAFVHGAMCVAHSGRCLLSAALTGRSGNRGECAQPCRWRYRVTEEKRPGEFLPVCEDEHGTYLFSAGDLCMIAHLHELRAAGVRSLKIEGRMKTAYYVATVVSAYRRALDLLEGAGEAAYLAAVPELERELDKASHRAFNTGFYFGPPSPPGGAEGFVQRMEYVGDVAQGAGPDGRALVRLKNRFFAGDALELLTPEGPKPFTAERMSLAETGEPVETASVAGTLLRMPLPPGAAEGDLLRGPNRNHRTSL